MKTLLALVLALALASPLLADPTASKSIIRRGDFIVMGVERTVSSKALDEFGMSSAITADLHITRFVRGRAPSRNLTIRYIAHSDLSTDRAFRFHLRRSTTANWLVCKQRGGDGYICN